MLARANIVAQIDEMRDRASASIFTRGGGGAPGYGTIIAELEGQLREIDELLGPGIQVGE